MRADGNPFSLAVVLRGEREQRLSNAVQFVLVSRVVRPGWVVFWHKNIASVDTFVFSKWVKTFIAELRRGVDSSVWFDLFFDSMRSNMSSSVTSGLKKNRILVMELPAHTSDRLQFLDVSAYGPFSAFSNPLVAAE